MTDLKIKQLAENFRTAIEKAKPEIKVKSDSEGWPYSLFCKFPTGCCGFTSDLLAEYLLRNEIETLHVCTDFHEQTLTWFDKEYHDSLLPQSHAFLVVKDERVKKPTPRIKPDYPDEILELLASYSSQSLDSLDSDDTPEYKYEDLHEGLIIDITADQFKGKIKTEFKDYFNPVYVGYFNNFYKSLVLSNVIDFKPLNDNDQKIYNIIEKYI